MRVSEKSWSGESLGLMARSGTWADRLPRWLTAPENPGSGGSSMGPRDRMMIVIALAGIVIWGFTGTWEYPTVESFVPPARSGATLFVEAPEQAVDPGGAVLEGAELFQANGCNACHSLEGDRKIGPSLRGVFGTDAELNDGSTVLIDEAYLVESILQPDAKRVAGYDEAAMPNYEDLVSAEDARALAEYIKSLE